MNETTTPQEAIFQQFLHPRDDTGELIVTLRAEIELKTLMIV